MTVAELQKTANEIRKGIVKATHAANPDIRADLYHPQTCLHIYILKR